MHWDMANARNYYIYLLEPTKCEKNLLFIKTYLLEQLEHIQICYSEISINEFKTVWTVL